MPSPFPGMNPYLEQDDAWHNFHIQFCSVCQDLLVPQVRPEYFVRLQEHVYIHELPAEERGLVGRADVSLAVASPASKTSGSTAVAAAPAYSRIPAAIDIEREPYIEIRDRRSRELITVLELLSPSNKKLGSDREQYLGKRRRIFAGPVHLVEIDLLRGGVQMPLEEFPGCDYYALVSRAEERPNVGVWPFGIRDPLPEIPIPLRSPDADARLDLKDILDRVYDSMGCEDYLYLGAPYPALRADDAGWAEQIVPRIART
jgi:hypothetical protein